MIHVKTTPFHCQSPRDVGKQKRKETVYGELRPDPCCALFHTVVFMHGAETISTLTDFASHH